MTAHYHIDKSRVADSFSQAAETYDSVARLQQQVGQTLLTRIPQCHYGKVMDLGSGTGFFTRQLAQRFPAAQLIGLDLAPGMLRYARSQCAGLPIQWVGGDAENLPLVDRSVDLVFSSLAIQWCYDLEALFQQLYRVLEPGGVAVFSTLGPGTLYELEQAWQQVDSYRHVNAFVAPEVLEQAMWVAGFADAQLQTQRQVLHYPKLQGLTRELKGIGAHNVNDERPTRLTSKRQLAKLLDGYERFRTADGLLPATYEVIYGVVRKSH